MMFIIARGGQTYARLRFNVGPGGECVIPVEVDYTEPFAASDHDAWQHEYQQNVIKETSFQQTAARIIEQDDPPIDVPFWTADDMPAIPDIHDEWPQSWMEQQEYERQCQCPNT